MLALKTKYFHGIRRVMRSNASEIWCQAQGAALFGANGWIVTPHVQFRLPIKSVPALWTSLYFMWIYCISPPSSEMWNGLICFKSWLSRGCLRGDNVISLRHWNMSSIKMLTPLGRGCARHGSPNTAANNCRHKDPVYFYIPFLLLLMSLVSPGLSIHMEYIESHSEFSCEPIRLRMCQDLPYNTTFMPNLLNHYDQQTAALAMEVGLCILFMKYLLQCVHYCCCG